VDYDVFLLCLQILHDVYALLRDDHDDHDDCVISDVDEINEYEDQF
jgi:hypothetical protein